VRKKCRTDPSSASRGNFTLHPTKIMDVFETQRSLLTHGVVIVTVKRKRDNSFLPKGFTDRACLKEEGDPFLQHCNNVDRGLRILSAPQMTLYPLHSALLLNRAHRAIWK
jgi:hypothetical protein